MKKILILSAILSIAFSLNAQNITFVDTGNATKSGGMLNLTDGSPVTVGWSWKGASNNIVVELSLVRIVNGQEVPGGYSITTGRSPATGKCTFNPRIVTVSGEVYVAVASFKTVLFGQEVARVKTAPFRINLCGPARTITLSKPTVFSSPSIEGSMVQFNWKSVNLPPSAKITIFVQLVNSEAGGVLISASDVGGHLWWQGDDQLDSGSYNVIVFYENEYGAFGTASNMQLLTIP